MLTARVDGLRCCPAATVPRSEVRQEVSPRLWGLFLGYTENLPSAGLKSFAGEGSAGSKSEPKLRLKEVLVFLLVRVGVARACW